MYLRNRVNGSTASKYREDGDEYDIKVRYAPEFRESVEDLENILIYNNEGKGIRIRRDENRKGGFKSDKAVRRGAGWNRINALRMCGR